MAVWRLCTFQVLVDIVKWLSRNVLILQFKNQLYWNVASIQWDAHIWRVWSEGLWERVHQRLSVSRPPQSVCDIDVCRVYSHYSLPLIGLFLFKNVLWMQLHSVYSSVTGFFHPACFWDLSVLLVSVVSYFWAVLRCMDTLFFNSFTCWTHGLFRVLALSKAVMSIVDTSFNFSWVGKSLVGGLLGHRVNNDWTL